MSEALRQSSDHLLEAAERAHDLKFEELGAQLLDRAVELRELARQLLELDSKRPTPAREHEHAEQRTFADAVLAFAAGDPLWERFVPRPAKET